MPRKSPIKEHKTPPMFVVLRPNDKDGLEQALAKATENYKNIEGVQRSSAAGTYRNVDPGISVRDGYNRSDYDYFRPGERLPTEIKLIQSACRQAYDKFGIVRNMIDMMTDFVVKDINIVHKSPKVQEFGRAWFKKVKGKSISSKIVRRLLREAAAPVRRKIQKITDQSITGITNAGAYKSPLGKDEIPLGYKVLNPSTIEVLGGELAQFVDEDLVQYGITIPNALVKQIQNPTNDVDKKIVQALKPDLLKGSLSGKQVIPMAPNRLIVIHHKKDDDQLWATPLLYAILDDLQTLEKLKLADKSALDGAISHVRLWSMGDLDKEIIPTAEGIQTLADILLRSSSGGCMDLVWGPDLKLTETKADQYKFLGNDKYLATMTSIYQGLGVPPSLTGTVSDTGMTNNFVSLRVLVERLDYCRDLLIDFWINELEIVRSVFGFRSPFSLSFGIPSLSDDSAEKKILVELIDRDIVSGVFVQERFGADPEIEQARLKQETRKRENGLIPPKAGVFHTDSQQKNNLEKLLVGNGEVTPSEVGIDLKPRKPGEVSPSERKEAMEKEKIKASTKLKQQQQQKTGKPKPGRAPGAKDAGKRKAKTAGPKQNAKAKLSETLLWANAAYEKIDSILKDKMLKMKGKSNLRQLTDEEVSQYEELKFGLLCAHDTGSEITEETVKSRIQQPLSVSLLIKNLIKEGVDKYIEKYKEKPTLDQIRSMSATAYAMFNYNKMV